MILTKTFFKIGLVRRLGQIFALVIILGGALITLVTFPKAEAAPVHPTGEMGLGQWSEFQTVGAGLPRIQCPSGYTATIYAEGLSGPDGMAFGPDDLLYVAEEKAGQVTQIATDGVTTTVLSGINSPEGITFDKAGNLYIAEDRVGGRVIKRTPAGVTTTLAIDRESPEGIVWVDDGASDGALYLTEQNLEQAVDNESQNPADYRTNVVKIEPTTGLATKILTTTATFVLFPSVTVTFWSYAGITVGSDGWLYLTNELSGQTMTGTIEIGMTPIDYTAVGGESVFKVDPMSPSPTAAIVADNLIRPEGLGFSQSGGFPLYVAEEDLGGMTGRLSQVNADGSHSPFCTGFETLEDVIVDSEGVIYVSEDSTGLVIAIKKGPIVWLPYVIKA